MSTLIGEVVRVTGRKSAVVAAGSTLERRQRASVVAGSGTAVDVLLADQRLRPDRALRVGVERDEVGVVDRDRDRGAVACVDRERLDRADVGAGDPDVLARRRVGGVVEDRADRVRAARGLGPRRGDRSAAPRSPPPAPPRSPPAVSWPAACALVEPGTTSGVEPSGSASRRRRGSARSRGSDRRSAAKGGCATSSVGAIDLGPRTCRAGSARSARWRRSRSSPGRCWKARRRRRACSRAGSPSCGCDCSNCLIISG